MVKLSVGFLAVVLAAVTGTLAAPWPLDSKHTTHQVRTLPNGLTVRAFHPEGSFETFDKGGIEHPLSGRATPANWKDAALSFAHSRLGGDAAVSFRSGFDGQASSHVFVQQRVQGVPVANAVANIILNKNGKVTAFGSNFVKPSRVASPTPKLTPAEAIAAAEKQLSATATSQDTTLEFFAQENGSLALALVVQAEITESGHLVEAFVDAHSGQVIAMHDFTTSLTLQVLPIVKQDPREGFEVLVDPEDPLSSPDGWITVPGSDPTNATSGNNAIAFKTSQTTGLSAESDTDQFEYTLDDTQDPTIQSNIDAARTNAFFIVNTIHDITYRYGFTEAAFNFQNNNFGKGGAGNDRVTISVQDAAGTNNADFSTPADGSSGRMRMFLWTRTTPRRDGAVENDIVAHENTHGLSNRLTGGGTGRCLQTTEAGGMGEGWSDAFAEWTEHKSAEVVDFTLGSYVINSSAGIRTHPYSTDPAVNPLTYADLQTRTEVHSIGEIWANTLHNLYAVLVGSLGFSEDAKTNPDAPGGNAVFLHLFIDALAIQPCNPTFLTARLAYITADQNRFGGVHTCLIWQAFASRGLGVNAANHVNNFDVPTQCQTTTPDPGTGSG